jgi:hypothetical protein
MKNPIERMLEEHREHLNPHHLFSVSNQDIDEKHRKKTMLPGHMAEGFIFNKNYLVEYVGPNAKSTPALREEKEKLALQSAQNDLEEVQRMLNSKTTPLDSMQEDLKVNPSQASPVKMLHASQTMNDNNRPNKGEK